MHLKIWPNFKKLRNEQRCQEIEEDLVGFFGRKDPILPVIKNGKLEKYEMLCKCGEFTQDLKRHLIKSKKHAYTNEEAAAEVSLRLKLWKYKKSRATRSADHQTHGWKR